LPAEYGGAALPIDYHPTIAKLENALVRKPDRWHILAPPLEGEGYRLERSPESADDLLKYSIRLSTAIRKRAWQREHPLRFWKPGVKTLGIKCPPIIVLIDEGIAVKSASTGGRGRSDDNQWFLQFIYSLRHLHIAMLYNIQEPTARSWRILEQATAIHVFAIRHQWALNAVQAAGATEIEITEIRNLDPYQHVTIE
jgi:hypothetical protein